MLRKIWSWRNSSCGSLNVCSRDCTLSYLSYLFLSVLSVSNFPFCWKHAFIQPWVLKTGTSPKPLTLHIAFNICLTIDLFRKCPKLEGFINSLFFKSLSDHEYDFPLGYFSDGLFLMILDPLLFDSPVALDTSNSFDRVWNKVLVF